MARMLYRLRGVLWVVGIAAGIWLAIAIADPATESDRSLLPISLIMWVGLALAVGFTLPRLPPAVESDDGLRTRLRKRIGQFGYGLAVFVILCLGGFALLFSFRSLSLVFSWP